MNTDGKSEEWSDDGSHEEEVASARLDAIVKGLKEVHTTIGAVLVREDELLTREEAVCRDIAELQDKTDAAVREAQSVVSGLNTTLVTLSVVLRDLYDAYAGIHECAERARHVLNE